MQTNTTYQDQSHFYNFPGVPGYSQPLVSNPAQDDILSREVQKQQILSMGSREREQNKAAIQLEVAQGTAVIELNKSFQAEKIRTAANDERAKKLADVQSCRELQRTEVQVSTNGRIIITRELFGEGKKQNADFRVMANSRVLICEEKRERVLYAVFCNASGQEKELFLLLSHADVKTIEGKFTAAGIGFKFSRKKNQEMLLKLVQTLIDNLPTADLPLKSGWRKRDKGKWEYIPIGILTWEEIVNAK